MRALAAVGVTVATLAVCALASADHKDPAMRGGVDHGGQARVQTSHYVRGNGQRMQRTSYRFTSLSVRCDGKWRPADLDVSGSESVWRKYADRNPFGVDTISGPMSDPHVKTEIRGDYVSKRKTRGWVRISGSDVPLRGGGSAACDSGRLRWVATAGR